MHKVSVSTVELNPQVRPEITPARPEPARDLAAGTLALIEGYRRYGYRRASINPLDASPRDLSLLAELDPRTYGLSFDDATRYTMHLDGVAHLMSMSELLERLRASYCGPIALDCGHVRSSEQRRWLHTQLETNSASLTLAPEEALRTLGQLAAAEAFEEHFRAKYSAYKQFSLEGGESMVTLLRAVLEDAAYHAVEDVVLGMPHRGRLNMMLNALAVSPKRLLTLFSPNPDTSLSAWDIKDHAGYSAVIKAAHGDIDILLAHNPSHLESVSPVVCGMARALQDRKADGSSKKVLPVLIHGDASFCAQGIVTETLNLSQTRGYGVGGTLHLILNNQIGSTISQERDARSTLHGADIARAIDAPIIHVNADDPDAVVFAAKLAMQYRMKFGADVVVDHIGYRRYGHFVGDDPMYTQPAMLRRIGRHRKVTELYAEKLARRGIAGREELDKLKAAAFAALTGALPEPGASPSSTVQRQPQQARPARTAVPLEQLRTIIRKLTSPPQNLTLHSGIQKMLEGWRLAAADGEHPVDWRLAENLAYGSLLANGFNVRLSGLDVGRGTFMHRQHMWHDQATLVDGESVHVPLRHVAPDQGRLSLFESPLSEEAVLGFEYGYSVQCGKDLVVWEAQFGDFVNNAQVIIDQYLATGEAKWGYASGLVCLLPHGHDGWGPEHTSAYLGRFLQLCATDNIRVAMPSSAAQMYHLLRRQALTDEKKPLVAMTPKPWLYGYARSHARLDDLASGEFQPLINDSSVDSGAVVRAIVTSGKLYYDLTDGRSRQRRGDVPVLRVEELYPFPTQALKDELHRFPRLREVVWAQEEAKNHGAWHLVREELESAIPQGVNLSYACRAAAAVCAGSSLAQHVAEQQSVVVAALGEV